MEIAGSEYQAAGAVATKGPLRILAGVVGVQQSYRADMYGAAIGTTIASGDKQYIDNMALTKCAKNDPCGSALIPTSATRCAITRNTSESSWSRSPVTVKSPRPTVHRNVSKFGAMGRSQTSIPSVQRI